MKNKIIIIIGILICINSCRMPSSPLGEIKIIKRLDAINTGGNCLDLDVDMDIDILKDALGAVVDEKLSLFKEELKSDTQTYVDEKLDSVAKSVEVEEAAGPRDTIDRPESVKIHVCEIKIHVAEISE